MDFACRLYHGKRQGAPSEVTQYPHLEILGSGPDEIESLKVLAEHLRTFACVPFSYRELESTSGDLHGAQLRVALHEREDAPAPLNPRRP